MAEDALLEKRILRRIFKEIYEDGQHLYRFSLLLAGVVWVVSHHTNALSFFSYGTSILVQGVHASLQEEHEKSIWAHWSVKMLGVTCMLFSAAWLQFHEFLFFSFLGGVLYDFAIHAFAHTPRIEKRLEMFLVALMGAGLVLCIAVIFQDIVL